MKKSWFLAVLALAGLAAASRADEVRIIGISPEEASRLPGAAALFNIATASQPPRLLSDSYIEGEVVARFPLEYLDAEIELIARMIGAQRAVRLSRSVCS